MALSPEKNKNSGESNIAARINEVIQKNRRILIIALCGIAVIITGSIIAVSVRDNMRESAFSRYDEFERRYRSLKYSSYDDENDLVGNQVEIYVLLQELEDFKRRNSGFAAARAYSLSADIYWDMGMWAEAENAWLDSAKAARNTYLEPISFYNAGAAAEEREDYDSALNHYRSALEKSDVFPGAIKAWFSIGKIEELRNNRTGALEAYRTLLANWPWDPFWSSLAQSRIIVLSD